MHCTETELLKFKGLEAVEMEITSRVKKILFLLIDTLVCLH